MAAALPRAIRYAEMMRACRLMPYIALPLCRGAAADYHSLLLLVARLGAVRRCHTASLPGALHIAAYCFSLSMPAAVAMRHAYQVCCHTLISRHCYMIICRLPLLAT